MNTTSNGVILAAGRILGEVSRSRAARLGGRVNAEGGFVVDLRCSSGRGNAVVHVAAARVAAARVADARVAAARVADARVADARVAAARVTVARLGLRLRTVTERGRQRFPRLGQSAGFLTLIRERL